MSDGKSAMSGEPSAPTYPGPRVLEEVLAHRLEDERLAPACDRVREAGARVAELGDHLLAIGRTRKREIVVVLVEKGALRREVVRVHGAHVGLELVTGDGGRAVAERAGLVTERPVPERVGVIRKLGELGEGHRPLLGALGIDEVHGLQRNDGLRNRWRGRLERWRRKTAEKTTFTCSSLVKTGSVNASDVELGETTEDPPELEARCSSLGPIQRLRAVAGRKSTRRRRKIAAQSHAAARLAPAARRARGGASWDAPSSNTRTPGSGSRR